MTVEIHGDFGANNLILSEKFRRYSTGIILFTGEAAHVEIDGPVTSGDIYLTVGSRAAIRIGGDCVIGRLSVHALSEGSRVEIGRGVGFAGSVSIAAHERAGVTIGSGCLIAEDVFISASDIHPVYDAASGERINPPADIRIGDRVWLGARAMVMKGVSIGHDSVVGAGAIVTGTFGPNSLIGGNPARLLRSGVRWSE